MLQFEQLFPNISPIMLEIFLTKLVDNIKHETSITDVSSGLSLKLFDMSENNRSAATEDGWMSKTTLSYMLSINVVDQSHVSSTSQACLNCLKTPSDTATYLGSSRFNACWTESAIILLTYSTYYASIILKC